MNFKPILLIFIVSVLPLFGFPERTPRSNKNQNELTEKINADPR